MVELWGPFHGGFGGCCVKPWLLTELTVSLHLPGETPVGGTAPSPTPLSKGRVASGF